MDTYTDTAEPTSFRGRRRGYQDDESDEESYHKRRRGVPLYKDTLERSFARLYSKGSTSLESNLESIANELEEGMEAHIEEIVDITTNCVLTMPNRMTIFSTLAGLLNAKKSSFGSEVLERLFMELKEKMENSEFFNATNIIVFISDLMNCRVVSLTSLVEFLESLLEAAFQDDTPQVRSDWFVFSVLHCLPWIGQEMQDKNEEALNNILHGIEQYMQNRHKEYLSLLQVWTSSTHEQEEYLDCLWAQVCKLREDGWKEKYITRHYVAFDGALTGAVQHNLPNFQPPEHSEEYVYPLPRVVFRLFDYTDCPEEGPLLPGAHSIERFLVEEELFWIIQQYCGNRKDCAAQLLDYSKRSLVPLNYVILEVVFAELFRLPEPPIRELFFGSLLIELCKNQAMSMPQVLAQAAELFYQRIDSMHPICVNRLVDWFSFHISNFEYQWSWPDWKDCITMDKLAPKKIFVRELLEKCMRLSYHERLVEFLPPYFEGLIPEKPRITYFPDNENSDTNEMIMRFETIIREKKPPDEVIPLLGNNGEYLATFLSVLLNSAKTTFSHSFAALTKYYQVLKQVIGEKDDLQMVVLVTIYDLWKYHHQMVVLLVRKLLVMSLVEAHTVVKWIFSSEMKNEFERLWVYELLSFTLQHIDGHVRRAAENVKTLKNESSVKKETNNNEENGDVEMANSGNGEAESENTASADVSAKEEELSKLKAFFKDLLIAVLHEFAVLLNEHIVSSEASGTSFDTDWYRLIVGRFEGIFLQFWEILWEFRDNVAEEVFKPGALNDNVLKIYSHFHSLRC
uniref:Nuclear cap-binding protein subunit 1 n=1 Tax=Syphacia muris TaxID=451379 RepID=A0A0N5AUR6_9BILA